MAVGSKITFTKYTEEDMPSVPDEAKASLFIEQEDPESRVRVIVATENEVSGAGDLVYLADVDMINDLESRISDLESTTPIVKSEIEGNVSVLGIQDLFLQAAAGHLQHTYGVDAPSNEGPADWNPSVGVLLGLFSRLTSFVNTTLTFTSSALTSIDTNFNVQVVPAASTPYVRSLIIDEGEDQIKNFITLFAVAPKGAGSDFTFSLKAGPTTSVLHICNNTTTFSLIVLIRVWDHIANKSKYCSIKFDDLKMIANAWT